MNEYRAVGVVGLGRMGLTLAAGFRKAVAPGLLFASGRSRAGVARLQEAVPAATVLPLTELARHVEVLVLCVRNADLPEVLDALRPRLTERHLVITLNNGLPLDALADAVPGPVAKLIPSVGNEKGAGATLLVPGPRLTAGSTDDLLTLLRAFSTPFVIEEGQGRAATDLASCGPALLAGAVRAMVDAQEERGAPLPRELAEALAAQSLHALSRLLGDGATLDEVVDRVAVPGGNTAAGLEAARDGLAGAWGAAFEATAENELLKPVPELGTGPLPQV
ncbi:pyrroline-5-carboxylate reductase [Streptomyces sp. NBC_00102]|uniref:pyrroline-5-carboxylate reductase family protein n=1 Tax=Streptomyces sp. NBC_00102 TaxID=2975652 RepID=UPI00225218ED|nr:pyrroline-5-carboxylate reductase dimerization domain-containing protein [Streptomyces sp. NBC_00102]MCX5397523.1 NAD(P)-binding domain-containing protein [Streptomyces sp. NBC_00102]